MIKLVIFDNNGTLEDDLLNLAYGSVVKIFNIHDLLPPTLEQYRQEITAKFMDFYYSHGFSPNVGHPKYATAESLNAIRKKYYEENVHQARFRPDAVRTLVYLKSINLKTAIVSSEIKSVLTPKLYNNGLLGLLDCLRAGVYGDKAPVLLEVCKELNVISEEALYVDDTVDGTSAAKSAGLIPVGFGNGYNAPERLRTITSKIIYELSELPSLIKWLNQSGE